MLQCSISLARPIALVSMAAAAASCSGSGARHCVDHSECVSGLCRQDGTCAPAADAGMQPDGRAEVDGGAGQGCRPDHDGVIARSELPLAAGRSASFRVAVDAQVNTAGELQGDGSRRWDLSGPYADDADVLVSLEPIDVSWFASSFPGATYAARLSEESELLGVFELNDTALLLRGVVSPQAGAARTELSYEPPAVVLELPLSATSQFNTTSTVSGTAQGLPSLYTEAYESRVDAVGELMTPFGVFPVLRVRIELTRTVGAAVVTKRSFLFLSECYGTVASVTSQDYESEPEFSDAAEVRRLAP